MKIALRLIGLLLLSAAQLGLLFVAAKDFNASPGMGILTCILGVTYLGSFAVFLLLVFPELTSSLSLDLSGDNSEKGEDNGTE